MKAARHVLRYLKGTHNFSITYGHSQELRVLGVSDANWGGDKNDCKSTTGYLYMGSNDTVSWTSLKQSTVATSTMETEYIAPSDAAREAIARSQPCGEFLLKLPPMISLDISDDPKYYRRAKYIDIRYHSIRHAIHSDQISINYIPSTENPADVLTKALLTNNNIALNS